MINILLADDHFIVRRGLRALIERHAEWRICAEASTGSEAVELAEKLQPQIAVLDLSMPDMSGIEVARKLSRVSPRTRMLIFTIHQSEQLIYEALAAGVRGYVLKADAARQLVMAIEALLSGEPYFTGRVTDLILRSYLRHGASRKGKKMSDDLTKRELEVLRLIAEGKSSREAAALLNISPKTVEFHRSAIMRRLNCNSVADLIRYAARQHLIDI